jgi:hypothetical protein
LLAGVAGPARAACASTLTAMCRRIQPRSVRSSPLQRRPPAQPHPTPHPSPARALAYEEFVHFVACFLGSAGLAFEQVADALVLAAARPDPTGARRLHWAAGAPTCRLAWRSVS